MTKNAPPSSYRHSHVVRTRGSTEALGALLARRQRIRREMIPANSPSIHSAVVRGRAVKGHSERGWMEIFGVIQGVHPPQSKGLGNNALNV